ncbi:hypothetical protein C2G38_1338215 [Gigaspora rosea]|uniref:Uncharacterized protein n=1 Tax=Gigaspora rosea TaxID=44941 RepID=A0A397V868_9GLOM|nr:hypothetical protein C2G38_1338215 [Gigaspora rosea]
MAVDDPMEVFQVVQNMPKRLIDCHKLIDACFRRRDCISEISQKDIERRREIFRERRKKRDAKKPKPKPKHRSSFLLKISGFMFNHGGS